MTVVTHPPYYSWRDYGAPPIDWGDWSGSLGVEPTPEMYVDHLMRIIAAAMSALRDDGTLWLMLYDSYAEDPAPGIKRGDLYGMPWTVALAMRSSGWYLRSEITWVKRVSRGDPSDRPASVTGKIFLMTKHSDGYYYDAEAVREPSADGFGTRSMRNVITVAPQRRYPGADFAVLPYEIARTAVLAGTRPGDVVLDPFLGAGTVGVEAVKLGRAFIGIEVSDKHLAIAKRRIDAIGG